MKNENGVPLYQSHFSTLSVLNRGVIACSHIRNNMYQISLNLHTLRVVLIS